MERRKIEIMDTTLRDGEQTSGVSFSISEKLTITQLLLEELKVDRVEIASARVSEGEFQAVKTIMNWAQANGYADRIEVLSFVDNGVSIEWMINAGVKVQNLLTKGSMNHLTHQLKKTPEQHFTEIKHVVDLAALQWHRYQCIPGRLEQRHAQFPGICLPVPGFPDRTERKTDSVARYTRHFNSD